MLGNIKIIGGKYILANFNFVGTAVIPKEESKRPFLKEFDKNGKKMRSLNFGVKQSDNNMAFVEAFGMKSDKIFTMSNENEKIEVAWGDRFDEDVIKEVASYKKITVNLGEDYGGSKTFLSMYDAIEFVTENLKSYKGKICVTGQMSKEEYKGEFFDKFKIQNIYAVDEDKKSRLTITADIYYTKANVDKADYRKDKVITLDGYIQQYINKDEGIKFVPQQFIFNASKYEDDNDKHQGLLRYKLNYIDIKETKTVQHLMWEIVLINGAEEVEFDESQLTKAQKEQIALGVRTIDDFKPRGGIYGDRILEYRLFEPILKGKFEDGLVDSELTISEFEDRVYVATQDEKLDDVTGAADIPEDVPFNKSEPKVDDDDLF